MVPTIFSKAGYFQESFADLSSSKEDVQSRIFEECEFKNCTFIETNFVKCKFLNCQFADCVLSAVKPLNSRFAGVAFRRSKTIGFDWPKAMKVEKLEFENCQINYSNFRLVKIAKIKILDCEAKEVDFIETDMSGGDFRNTDFERSVFFKTNLTGADFRGARNYKIDARNNVVKKARFSVPEVLGLLSGLEIFID